MNYGQVPYDLCQLGGVIANVLGIVSEVAELRVEPALTIALQPPGHGVGLVPQAAGGRMNDVHRVSSRHSSRFVVKFFRNSVLVFVDIFPALCCRRKLR